MNQTPTIGRIVAYTLTAFDAAKIEQNRTFGDYYGKPLYTGNRVAEGDVFPLLITRTWGDTPESAVNGQVLLDGNDSLWVTSTSVGEGPGRFAWPTLNVLEAEVDPGTVEPVPATPKPVPATPKAV